MPHDITLISTIAVAFASAFIFGFAANRLGFSPLVGYLMAGVTVGPFSPGFVADSAMAGQLAEIGVMLLMFGVGLHFSVADLMAVRRLAIPGAVGQIVIATFIAAGIAMTWGWSLGAASVLGLSLSVASGMNRAAGTSGTNSWLRVLRRLSREVDAILLSKELGRVSLDSAGQTG